LDQLAGGRSEIDDIDSFLSQNILTEIDGMKKEYQKETIEQCTGIS
jgi:hypothetical protein